jgi:hypothetical protein
VIVGQMLQKLFPLCRQRYCKPNQLAISPSICMIQVIFKLQTRALIKSINSVHPLPHVLVQFCQHICLFSVELLPHLFRVFRGRDCETV